MRSPSQSVRLRWPLRSYAGRIGALGVFILLMGSGGSCSEDHHRPTTPEASREPDLRLLVVTDLGGYLEPCGCTTRPLGGIDRMAARIASLREGNVPTLFLAAGNLFFHGAPHGADAERATDQEVMRARAVRDALDRLELTAAAPGPLDFGFGTDTFAQLARDTEAPILAAGVHVDEDGEAPLTATTIRRVGDLQVGIVGLSDLRSPDGALPDGVTADELRASAGAAVEELRSSGADLIVAVVHADRRTARRVATGVEGIDFLVHGGLDIAEANVPATTAGAVIVHAGRHGQGLVVVDIFRCEGEGWSDRSEWTRADERLHVEERVEALRRRIAAWEADPDTPESDVAAQRQRLSRLEAELAELATPPTSDGSYFEARYEELAPGAPRDATFTQLMGALDRRVNEHNRGAFADWEPASAPDGEPHYVGSQTCAACHGGAMAWWRGHAHGRAYATLEEDHKNFNLSCVGCHVTGYLEPGGSTVTHVERLENVGCESCHGPGSLHVSDPADASVNVTRAPIERTCGQCHTPDHSDSFDFETYRDSLIVPGHGRPAAE